MNELLHAFKILNVKPGCDDATLRKAWRALVRTYHPDMAKADPKRANQRLAEINAAWDLVSSSSEIEVQRLAEMLAKRDRDARQQRKDMERRRTRARAAFKAAQETRMREKVHAGKHSTAEEPVVRREKASGARQKTAAAEADALAKTQITTLARRAFETARVVCSSELRSAAGSVYM
ncbi:J domain-containing protein [Tateyamaria pelophila]|uniref:J domain-containing protein n=1 Tax=Tateyamaria pelophila TaxID=328415 RepID=UPI001CBBA901|nr:J domain-containing protein [Tateyamaria pelophila]